MVVPSFRSATVEAGGAAHDRGGRVRGTAHALPSITRGRVRVHLRLPHHLERHALRVVIEAREAHEGHVAAGAWHDIVDEVLSSTDRDDVAGAGRAIGKRQE